jgi:hypothetical protein
MYCILPGEKVSTKVFALGSRDAVKQAIADLPAERVTGGGAGELPGAVARAVALRGAERRRVLGEIRRNKVASVDVPFFARNELHATDGTLSRQFIEFFELSPAEAGQLSDLIQATRAEMWNAAKAQAQVSRSESGGVVIKIPPVAAGADIYDRVMNGFQAVLGDGRYNDMMFFNNRQFERMFNEFGAEERTLSIEAGEGGRYRVTDFVVGRPGEMSSTYSYRGSLDDIKKRNPELVEFVPGQGE